MRSDAIVHGNLDVVSVSAGLICDRCGKKKTMEVYLKSSWFLLLLGFALIAATLQETADCPTPEQVSCTSGVKCNEDGDCQSNEKCCANACYTKRCIPTSKGVQGDPKTDGPSETDCRPYIEKALKELETGEAGHAQEEPSDKDESSEDVPTVEITDDSSHQEEVDGDGKASEEDDHSTEQDATQQEAVPESAEDDKSEHDSGETPDEKEVEKSEEKHESEEETKTEASKEESAEQTEVADQVSAEDDEVVEQGEVQASAESVEEPEPSIVKREAPVPVAEPIPIQTAAASQEDESGEKADEGDQSAEAPQEPEGKSAESKEEGEEEPQPKSKEASVEASSEQPDEGSEENAEGGCPPPEKVSCTEGELCAKHRHCGENQICCANKCYRKRCVEGTVPQSELDAESASEESEEAKSEEKSEAPSTPETGCPSPSEVSCTEGDLCSKHKQCGEDHICCPNKCYRRRCVPGTATSAELAEESDEESEEEKNEKASPETTTPSDARPDTGCPAPSEVSCVEGDLCSKHKQCGEDQICCPNKCYRRRCVAGKATSAELAEESDEESEEDKKEEEAVEKTTAGDTRPDTGCPNPSEVSCVEGDLCSKHRHCGDNQICCPNKCYRRRCTPGTPTDEDLAEEESSEETSEADAKAAEASPSTSGKDTGCPDRNEVPCGGEKCLKNKQCDSGEICCANKCYRKVCVTGTPGSEEEDEESEEAEEPEEIAEAAPESVEDESGCPSPDKVSCTDGERCGEDEDCGKGEICCPNKCYNKRCVPGSKDEDGSEEALPPLVKVPPPKIEPKVEEEPKKKVDVKEEVKPKEEVKAKTAPPPPPPPAPKKEEKKPPPPLPTPSAKLPPPPPAPSKPITVVEPVVEAEDEEESAEGDEEGVPVEDLLLDAGIPSELRTRDHVEHLLKLDKESSKLEHVQNRVYEQTLKELKKLYENAIKPLEVLYKYRDLSNRHFGDAEIFSKPLILFMGPWSGGKSSIINYLTNNEYNDTALRTGAEPSPAYFNILMYGDEPEIIDGTELAADFTFSGLQKFGQGLEERLRGVKLPSKLLEKVNIVEIPGILEVRKQVSRLFPFNDACQWFIDRADIIFLVYDPSKLDVGPETEAILDQLKGREHQTRIILNKADQVKAEELMRVQGALIWNISPLMSSPQPPVMYTTSLWSRPFEPWAPTRLLQAQERAFLRDLRSAVDRRVENKIASARRFAVRVRNHAKMVDCYLTTYYNHKSVFGNRKQVANEIIDHPQDYHIYEGLSTLTNISRYDLPDPDVYRDFFKLNPLYEFQQLSATCTYFRGCPINRLDIAIAYDLPELVGTYKRHLEEAINNANNPPKESSPSPSKKTKNTAPGS